MSRILLAGVLSFALGCGALAGQTAEQEKKAVPSQEKQASTVPPQREGFFTFATKMINPKNTDYGQLIAARRAAFADASATNSYFWYSAGSTAAVLILLFVLYVKLLEHKSYQWRAAEVIADLRNAEKLATAKAKESIATYKRHMLECNRVVEHEIAGRVLPGAVANQDIQRTAESLRHDLQTSTAEINRLVEQLKSKENLIKDLTGRIDALEQADPITAQPTASSEKSYPELLALLNRLTRDLDLERRRNGALKGA